jgi:hypothetical protein
MYDVYLIPECYADTLFVEGISFEFNNLTKHASGNDAVSRMLRDSKNHFKAIIGFIDKDKKNNPTYFDDFKLVNESDNVQLKYLEKSNRYLFVLNPAIDKFIWDEINKIGLDVTEFNLPNDFKRFKNILKSSTIERHDGYKRLIKALKRANSPGVDFLLKNIEKILVD